MQPASKNVLALNALEKAFARRGLQGVFLKSTRAGRAPPQADPMNLRKKPRLERFSPGTPLQGSTGPLAGRPNEDCSLTQRKSLAHSAA